MEILTTKDVATMLGVSTETVTRWARENGLPALQAVEGGSYRFDRAQVRAWLKTRLASSQGAPEERTS